MAVSVEDLEKIITTTLDYQEFINIAECVLSDITLSSCYDDCKVDNITKYFAAHLIAVSDASQNKKREKIDTAEDEYFDSNNTGSFASWGSLGTTKYGQTVKLFDSCSLLQDLGKDKITPIFENI